MLPHHALKVFGCYLQQPAQLLNALIRDIAGGIRRHGLVKEFLGLFLVGPRYVKSVFECGFVLNG